MKIRQHNDGTYSLTGLTRTDISDLEAGLGANSVGFCKGAEAQYLPSGYDGWTLEQYRETNTQIRDRLQHFANFLRPVAYPLWLEDEGRYETIAEGHRRLAVAS